jgi:hypothetical protein
MRSIQQAGLHLLWGERAASGARHEIDAACRRDAAAYLIEAKAKAGLTKADLAVFELKVSDYYFSRWRSISSHAWWPILSTSGRADDGCRRLAAHRSIILCDPERLPLPVLYHHAAHPAARTHLPETLCRELVRLAPRALQTLQERYVPDTASGCLRLEPCPYTTSDLDELLFLQTELTDEVLTRYDRHAPGRLEGRGHRLLHHLRAA